MKTYTGKTNGKAFKGICTNSCMPNQKPKRIKKDIENMNPINDVKININLIGIFSAIITAIQAPLDMNWKVCLIVLFLLTSIDVEVNENE